MTSTLGIKKIQYPNGTNSITIDSSGSADITTANITTAAITTANVTNATATGTITTPSINGGQIGGRRNIVINGAMQVAQRGTSVASITSGAYRTADRMYLNMGTAGTWTNTVSTDVPTGQGFAKSFKLDCTTANGSLSAGSYMTLQHRIEAQNIQYLKKGTANAESLTLSFWVKSAKTGTYIAYLKDEDNNRDISKSYTISSANTWEKKTITFPPDTTGALNNDNGIGLYIYFWLVAGSTYLNANSGSLQTTWATSANSAAGQVNLADSTSNDWYITGIQLEAGSQATEFEHRSFAEELQLCSRYFWRQYNSGTNAIYFRDNISAAGQNILYQFPAPPAMRINGATVTCSLTANVSVNSNTLTYHQHGAIQVYLASISGDNYLYSQDLSINAEL